MNVRSAKSVESFPYKSKLVCYILVENNNVVTQPCHYVKSQISELINAVEKVKRGEAALYAVWPGNYRSDLFLIDDIDLFAEKFELKS